jgi:glycosyltransferase involved in cell wall biosynthesis
MKLLVFAHKPPPHHGQSYMVQLMLDGFGGDRRRAPSRPPVTDNGYGIECYHVNARLSKHLEDIGEFRPGKLLLLLRYCLEAIWCRFRYDVPNLYYIPGPGKTSALYRDWLVMALCRPFFRRVILHWHAAGLAKWLETAVQMNTRVLTWRFLKHADLSIVLSNYNVADANKFFPRRVRVVNNGIPDPCPEFEQRVLPRRRERFAIRQRLLATRDVRADSTSAFEDDDGVVRVLYLAHCTREKGLFDAVEAVMLANRALRVRGSRLRLKLLAAGTFVSETEKAEFLARTADPEIRPCTEYLGFVAGEDKARLLAGADLFCFPTYYLGENQPVNLIEAMAFGLPVVTTRWRSLPEMLPPDYPGIVPVRAPDKVAAALLELMTCETGERLRALFEQRFTLEKHLAALAEALRSAETHDTASAWAGAAQPS